MNESPEVHLDPELLEHFEGVIKTGKGYNDDFISPETYGKVFDEAGDLKGKRIIDLGASIVYTAREHSTDYLRALDPKGAQLIPVDITHNYVKTWNLIRGHNNEDETKITPLTADALQLPFAKNSIDGCIAANLTNLHWSVVNETPSRRVVAAILKEVNRILKPKGFAVLSSFGYYKNIKPDGTYFYNNRIPEQEIITNDEMAEMARKAGFEVTELPTDEGRIDRATKRLNEDRSEEVDKVEVVAPTSLLLKK